MGKIAEACKIAMPTNVRNFNVDNVRVAKIIGNAVDATTVVRGLCLPRNVAGTIKEVRNAKIVVYGVPIDSATTETKGTVLLKSADELKKYNDSEEDHLEAIIKAIAEAGANVIVCAQTIGELALHFVEKYKMMVLKVPSKFELRRLCRSTGASTLVRLEPPNVEDLGSCNHVHVKEIGSPRCTIFDQQGDDDSHVATIVVRGSTMNIMDDGERAIDDGVNVVKSMTKDARFLPGAGATELLVADHLQLYAEAQPGLDQYAIHKFGLAMEVVPRTLAQNAGLDAARTVAETPVLDLLLTKKQAIQAATEAAVTVLRVDQIIMSKPAGGPKKADQPIG